MKLISTYALQSSASKFVCATCLFLCINLLFAKVSAQCTTGTCTITVNSSNSSNLTVNNGDVVCVVGGGSLTGSLTINAGGKLNLSGGSITSSSAIINGLIAITSGTFNPSNLTLNSGGTICNGSGQKFQLNTWNFNGGSFNNYGTFLGSLNLSTGTAFNNYSGAALMPSNSINTFQGTLTNYGNADFSQGISAGSGGVYDSYGTTRFRANFNWNGSFAMTNEVGATMTFDQVFGISSNSTYVNHGKAYVNSNFNVGNGSKFTNTGRIEVTGGSAYDGTVINTGFIYNNGPSTSSIININSSANVQNSCRFVTTSGFNNNSPNTVNDGLIWVLNNAGNSPNVQINAKFTQTVNGLLRGTSFVNQNIVSGGGNYYFTGTTSNQGTFGTGSDAPNFYDVSNTANASNRGFDTQTGTVSANETANSFIPKDTSDYTNGCNADFAGVSTAKDSTLSSIAFPPTNKLTISFNSFTGSSSSSGNTYGYIAKVIFTAIPSNCTYITINGIKYGTGYTAFPSGGDTVLITNAGSTLELGLLSSAATAGRINVPFNVMNNEGQPSAFTANVVQPFTAVLPITFGNLSANAANCIVRIDFETLTEQNNKAFVIEHGTDDYHWTPIATIASKGNSASIHTYSFLHTTAATGSNYYRIKQIDLDGSSTYSGTLFLNNNCNGLSATVTSYPNPIKEQVTISFPTIVGSKIIRITNVLGMVLQITATTGNIITIPTNNLVKGIYGLEVMVDGNKVYTQKLLKQ